MPTKSPAPETPQEETQTAGAPVLTPERNESAPTPVAEQPLSKKRRYSKKLVLIVVAALLVLGGGGAAAYVLLKKPFKQNQSAISATTKSVDQSITDTQSSKTASNVVFLNGNTYYPAPKKIDSLKFFKDYSYFGQSCSDGSCKNSTNDVSEKDVDYFEVGTTKDNKKIIAVHDTIRFDDSFDYIAIENTPGNYAILVRNSGLDYQFGLDTTNSPNPTDYSADFLKILAPNVTADKTTKLAELTLPSNVTVAGQKLTNSTTGYSIFMANGLKSIRGQFLGDLDSTKGQTVTKIGTSGLYDFYKVVTSDQPTYKVVSIYGAVATSFSSPYNLNGELSSTKDIAPITWSAGEQTKSAYFSAGQGCGGGGYVVANNIDSSTLAQVGTTKNGQKIFQLPTADPLVQYLYTKDYDATYKDDSSYNTNKELQGMTVQQFTDKHAYFLVLNGFNEYTVFQRDGVFQRGGCGKPVVYLYPTTPTNVSVKVGADVVKSAPFYNPTDGWKNVFAQPDGQLTVSGTSYDSLYWEGYGNGSYPEVTTGTIVKSSDAVATITSQLSAQGFNAKESADFLAYWQPKLPTTPYVRLTWFGTGAMNQLAPLTIKPAPQTIIRTFLDFEGLQRPVPLSAQTFKSPRRQGFTVVEWGGLLRNGIEN